MTIFKFFKRYPACLLLIVVYLSFLNILSYNNAWSHPEQFSIKIGIMETGPYLNAHDISNGLAWKTFEFVPRDTRALSSYFEIIDTKFRSLLWHFMLPHPSLSLTWIFSLILAPFFLYQLLKNIGLSINAALTMVAFYLLTPAILSNEVMLHRPGKPMANFSIIFCLYLASQLKTQFIDQKKEIPFPKYLIFWAITAISFYWDETVWLILPAMFFIFPEVIRKKEYLLLWCLLPLITLLAYFKIIPYLSILAGHGFPHLEQYDKVGMLDQKDVFIESFRYLVGNTKSLVLDSIGIMPFSHQASVYIKCSMIAALVAWGVLLHFIAKARHKWDHLAFFLIGLILFFNYSMAITEKTWGPYYYGGFWSIFFTIYLGKLIEKALIPSKLLLILFLLILINMVNCFLDMNMIIKKSHYHWPVSVAKEYFQEKLDRFDPRVKPVFSGEELKYSINYYWSHRNALDTRYSLPKELCWLSVELKPPSELYVNITKTDFIETN